MAGVAAQLAGCVPSEHKALGFIPSTGITLVWWWRPVIPALRRRLSYLPEITQLVRSKDRSQRALSWVPSLFSHSQQTALGLEDRESRKGCGERAEGRKHGFSV